MHSREGVRNEQPAPDESDFNVPGLVFRDKLVYLVTQETDYGQMLAQQIGHFGYRVQLIESFRKLENAIASHLSLAILVDMDLEVEGEAREQLLDDFKRLRNFSLPIMFISARDDQARRLEAIRVGGKAFFHKPVDIVGLVDKLDEYDVSVRSEIDRVLVIESQPTIGNYYQMVLKRAGMYPQVVNNADQVLSKIAEFNPDLILLDLQMPKINGAELTMVIRQIENYVGIPIVFISSEDGLSQQTEVMSLGGDDFLTKPVKGDQLISVIHNRLARSQALREFMIHDSLTGLLNHTTYREYLKQEINRCKRQNRDLALAMLDLDNFKKVNDMYGHAVGDSVLKSLSRLLKQSLRRTDIVGRHGGEEFVVILLDANAEGAFSAMDNIRNHFSQIRHFAPRAGEFCVTFSCGIAAFPQFGNVSLLSDAADQALYEAKAAGRNRVMVAKEA